MDPSAKATIVPCWTWALALAVVATLHVAWFATDARGPAQDQFRYYEMALHLRGDALAADHPSHPPLYSALAALVPGRSFHALRWINCALALLTLAAAYRFARHWLPAQRALAAALCGTMAPLVVSLAHLFYIENLLLPLVLLALSMFFDQRTRGSLRPALLLGSVCAAGCLAKWTFPLFVLPAALWWFWNAAPRARWAATLACILLAGPWYALHANAMAAFLEQGVLGGAGHISRVEGLSGWLYYPKALAGSWLGMLTLVAAVIGWLRLARERRTEAICLALTLLLPLVVFAMVPTKKPRHLLPLVPLLALAATSAAASITSSRTRGATIALLLASTLAAGCWVSTQGALTLGPLPLWMRAHSDDPGVPQAASEGAALAEATPKFVGSDDIVLLTFHTPHLRDTDFRAAALEQRSTLRFRLLPLHLPDARAAAFPLHAPNDPDGSAGLLEAQAVWVKGGLLWTRVQSGLPVQRNAVALTEALLDPDGLLAGLPVLHETTLEDSSVCRLIALPNDAATRRKIEWFAQQFATQARTTPVGNARALQDLSDAYYTRSADAASLKRLVDAHLACSERTAALRWVYRGILANAQSFEAALELAQHAGLATAACTDLVMLREALTQALCSGPR